jgi:hypothetical protein
MIIYDIMGYQVPDELPATAAAPATASRSAAPRSDGGAASTVNPAGGSVGGWDRRRAAGAARAKVEFRVGRTRVQVGLTAKSESGSQAPAAPTVTVTRRPTRRGRSTAPGLTFATISFFLF